jgi:DNA-binding transcriptional regulator YhcF (GntR family)
MTATVHALHPDNEATAIGDLYRKARTSATSGVRYAIEAGQRLAAKKKSLDHGDWLPWLKTNKDVLGFENDSTARRLMKAAANRALTHDLTEAEATVISRQIWGNTTKKKKSEPRSARSNAATPQTDAAYLAIAGWAAQGNEWPGVKKFAKQIGISHATVEKARDRWTREQREHKAAVVDEDQALAKAEAQFSEKSKLTIADAIRIHKARLDKIFEQTVNAEVRRRIDTADSAVREQLKKANQQLLVFERERGKRGVFSKEEYGQMLKLCHPDQSASKETCNKLLQILTERKLSLINPDKK